MVTNLFLLHMYVIISFFLLTLFFYSPYIYIQDEVRTVEDEGLQVGEVVMDECSIKASFMTYPPNFFFW